jgi:hypothetical protein
VGWTVITERMGKAIDQAKAEAAVKDAAAQHAS